LETAPAISQKNREYLTGLATAGRKFFEFLTEAASDGMINCTGKIFINCGFSPRQILIMMEKSLPK
jgi:hypothetical protein